ncbi:MAG: hypothetical protein LBO80_11405 [Treponema sp.]|jgi:hypothetical protein|nr:hypothetical protein [Treponema sp.]
MSFQKAVLMTVMLSLGLALAIILLIRFFIPAAGAYGVLGVDADCSDKETGALLRDLSIGGYISESTQLVYLDDFDSLRPIPLDEYQDRVEDFDPRNDGYAEKLRSFFVRGGKRYFYIPLSGKCTSRNLAGKLAPVTGDLPGYSLEILGSPRSFFPQGILFIPAAAGLILLLRPSLPAFSLLPLLGAAVFLGPPGFALGAVISALFSLFLEPLRGWFVSRRYACRPHVAGRDFSPWDRKPFWRKVLLREENFRPRFLSGGILLAAYGLICFSGNVPSVPALVLPAGFFIILGFSVWAESIRGLEQGHIRFFPVPIAGSFRGSLFPAAVLPFALGAILSLFLSALPSGVRKAPVSAGGDFLQNLPVIREEDYQNHLAFQSSFSVTPLGEGEDFAYRSYYLGEDGLIAGVLEDSGGNRFPEAGPLPGDGDFPPFPLADLTAFLERGDPRPGTGEDRIPAILGGLLCVPVLLRAAFRYRKKKKMLVYSDKRIAA